jgi:hypothetical protein
VTFYWPDNNYLLGTIGTAWESTGFVWDWAIEIFLGTIWEESKGDFDTFVKELIKTWLEEWLHMVYRWERIEEEFSFSDEEKPVKAWVQMLTEVGEYVSEA